MIQSPYYKTPYQKEIILGFQFPIEFKSNLPEICHELFAEVLFYATVGVSYEWVMASRGRVSNADTFLELLIVGFVMSFSKVRGILQKYGDTFKYLVLKHTKYVAKLSKKEKKPGSRYKFYLKGVYEVEIPNFICVNTFAVVSFVVITLNYCNYIKKL
jgi:hypothetical protein